MTITSFYYFAFITIGVLVYYIIPKSWQWIELLVLSVVFYCLAATPYTIIYLIISTVIVWGITNGVERSRLKNMSNRTTEKPWYVLTILTVVFLIALWFVLKGRFFFVSAQSLLGHFFPGLLSVPLLELTAALGMGYYTLQLIGYVLDCYWQTSKPQKNVLKLFLFTAFFPQLITGPISRYSQLYSLYEKHRFSYENVTYGAQRILWGLFKKLVLSERAGIIVNAIWANTGIYHGFYFWVAILLYPIQMYADFSGCMDIVIGTAEMFGIKLPENFNNPFFSRSSQEFWQRWHITLGSWAKDYVLYPILKSKFMVSMNKTLKKKVGKKWGKFLATALGMFALWMVMGIWHGAFKYIIGVSLWYWIVLMLGELTEPFFAKMVKALGFHVESFSWKLFQAARTYVIYAIGAVFFRAGGISEGIHFLRSAVASLLRKKYWNPWVFFDGSVLNTGVTYRDINILIFGVLALLVVAILREKHGFARNWVAKQTVVFRWMIWLGMFVFVLIYGMYGPGYDAAEFIYQGF